MSKINNGQFVEKILNAFIEVISGISSRNYAYMVLEKSFCDAKHVEICRYVNLKSISKDKNKLLQVKSTITKLKSEEVGRLCSDFITVFLHQFQNDEVLKNEIENSIKKALGKDHEKQLDHFAFSF